MVVAVRAEAVITAQNKLRPGLAQAAAELSRFRAMQTKATAAFSATAGRVGAAASQRMQAASQAMAARTGALAAAGRSQLVTLGGPAALAASYKQFADVDRQITHIGITAETAAGDLAGVRKQIEGIAYETAQSSGNVTGGLEVLVAQGRTLKESLEFLPSVARTSVATNSKIEDIAKSADAVASSFKIAGSEMQTAFDIMAIGGKLGQFEAKDMSRYLPSLAPAAAAVGFTGKKGLSDLVAMLQVMRKGSGSSEEAASSMSNVLMKMDSDETRKNFKKFGIDSQQALDKTRKAGGNVIETFMKLINVATKGDAGKIGEIVKDSEFKRGVLALKQFEGMWERLTGTMQKDGPGTIMRDLPRVTNDARAQIDRMFSAIENRAVQVGGVLAKYLVLPADEAIKRIERGENETVNKLGELAKFSNANVIAKGEISGTTDRKEYPPDFRKLVDARKEMLTREAIEKERARLGDEISKLQGQRDAITSSAAAETGGKVMPPFVAATLAARTKAKTDPIDAKITPARQSLDELNALVAKIDEINLQLAEKQGEMGAALKPRMSQMVGEVKADIAGLGSAGQTAGSQLADGFSQGLSRMENEAAAAVSRIQQKLSSLRAPSLSVGTIGGGGGFDTGRQGPN